MRPHNKSTLWDEFLEHYNKDQRFFNTKHKKAYCKRCIQAEITKIDQSPEFRQEFQKNTDITDTWEQWKRNRGELALLLSQHMGI